MSFAPSAIVELEPSDALGLTVLLEQQFGVADFFQLRDVGLSSSAIGRGAASGRLIRIYRGVYAVGHASLRMEGRWMATLLACGEDAWLSLGTAAAAYGWQAPGDGRIHVITARRNGRRLPSPLLLHRVRNLPEAETGHIGALRITSPARTLLDLSATLTRRQLEQVIHESVKHQHFDLRTLNEAIARHPGRAGTPVLIEVLEQACRRGLADTRSPKEVDFLSFCDRHRLPTPCTNVPLLDFTVDAHWPAAGIVVEIDSWAWHGGRRSFEEDRARDQKLTLAGYRVIRLTARQLEEGPERIATMLRVLLAGSGAIQSR